MSSGQFVGLHKGDATVKVKESKTRFDARCHDISNVTLGR